MIQGWRVGCHGRGVPARENRWSNTDCEQHGPMPRTARRTSVEEAPILPLVQELPSFESLICDGGSAMVPANALLTRPRRSAT
jgi:hypothetical protein